MRSGSNDLNAILQRPYTVNIGGFIGRGAELFQSNLGLFVGFAVISIVINVGLAFIPIIGSLVSLVIGGPLNGGYFIAAFKLGKRQPIVFGDFFKGFQNAYFLQLFLVTLVPSLLIGLCFVPMGVGIFLTVLTAGGGEPNPVMLILGLILGLAGLAVGIYLGVSYVFAVPLVVGKKLEFWPAMEFSRQLVGKQWLSFLGFAIVLGLINFVGALLFGIGLLFTLPLSFCAIAAAYESIIGLPTFDPSQA